MAVKSTDSHKKINNSEEEKSIKIFATSKGLNVVKSPVKSNILSFLKEKDMSFEEIVKLTGKSKSTVSAHLTSLSKEGIIESRHDPTDQRKKIFFINSRFLGNLTPEKMEEQEEQKVEFLIKNLTNQGNPFEFFRLMFHTLRVELIQEGINIDPLLHQVGIKIGEAFFEQLNDRDTDKLLTNLASFWEANGLGNIVVESQEPLTIRAYDCFECGLLPNLGESACALDSGILKTVFSGHWGREINVEETKCYARGDKYCCFVIGP
jgi:predicted hydrocarbon binding protein/predicted transcriptional regulator